MSELEIVAATGADLDDIVRIETESFPIAWHRHFFESELHAPHRHQLVAKRDGVVIGYVFAMWILDEMHINKIAVDARERRNGVAEALMARCFDFARANGIASISLEVRRSNHGAQEFYRALDFRSTYVRPRYYPDGESAVIMVREV